MKRSLVLIAAAVVLGVLLGGFTLVGHTPTTKAALGVPITINMTSFTGEAASGVVGTTTITDVAYDPVHLTWSTYGTAMATGITAARHFYPAIGVFYFTGQNCAGNAVALLLNNPSLTLSPPNGNNMFLTDSVVLGAGGAPPTGTQPAVLWKPTNDGLYTGGAESIGSVEVADLTGFNATTHAYRKADVQHFACGNADGSPVANQVPFGGHL